jgi:hypothetical protein
VFFVRVVFNVNVFIYTVEGISFVIVQCYIVNELDIFSKISIFFVNLPV